MWLLARQTLFKEMEMVNFTVTVTLRDQQASLQFILICQTSQSGQPEAMTGNVRPSTVKGTSFCHFLLPHPLISLTVLFLFPYLSCFGLGSGVSIVGRCSICEDRVFLLLVKYESCCRPVV